MVSGLEDLQQQHSGTLRPQHGRAWMFKCSKAARNCADYAHALGTPFTSKGRLRYERLERNVEQTR